MNLKIATLSGTTVFITSVDDFPAPNDGRLPGIRRPTHGDAIFFGPEEESKVIQALPNNLELGPVTALGEERSWAYAQEPNRHTVWRANPHEITLETVLGEHVSTLDVTPYGWIACHGGEPMGKMAVDLDNIIGALEDFLRAVNSTPGPATGIQPEYGLVLDQDAIALLQKAKNAHDPMIAFYRFGTQEHFTDDPVVIRVIPKVSK